MDTDSCAGLSPAHYTIPLLLSLPGFGPASYWRLYDAGVDMASFWQQPPSCWLPLLPAAAREPLRRLYAEGEGGPLWQACRNTHLGLQQQGYGWLLHTDPGYPELLRQISQPPPLLYLLGNAALLESPQVAFVGSRRATRGGLHNSQEFARYLAAAGITITSGLALGIDAAAHRGALAASGATVAVLGTGIDCIYPRSNRQLAEEIVAAGGLLVSEFAPGTGPHAANFPRRNRVVSGLSLGVLVVEAALQSGSLITARLALEQNREVFAIPGSIHNPLSRGCHALLRDGATLVETAMDIAAGLQGWVPLATREKAPAAEAASDHGLSGNELQVWQLLDEEPLSLDELAPALGLPVAELLGILMALEIRGLVLQEAGSACRAPGVSPVDG
ncbi:DNA-processing protein DprA [Pseudomaricurvus sp. HS19]|uniref:DNA-processing protein DprA n=1 Tax=Pseudomaricurvus sp. HS19 TaxID=2692626 RepID=UPI00136E4DD7|nr:DNA-processing protein DprA [Pseudomaricurvus sp. HS19]MYM63746.1 DNA-protecting protein DprA [Pseudomaricurvus sp. HS19]